MLRQRGCIDTKGTYNFSMYLLYYYISNITSQKLGYISRQFIFKNQQEQMSTELKPRKSEISPSPSQKSPSIEDEFIGYNFLRNIWGTYFHDRHDAPCQDKIDSINKIVGMMKAQIRLMILNENKVAEKIYFERDKKEYQICHKIESELSQTKQALERSKMNQEELIALVDRQADRIKQLQSENQRLKVQLCDLKDSKNKVVEQIIELSKKIYELQHQDCQTFNEPSFLEQYSAITINHESEQRETISLFNRKDSISVFNLREDSKSLHSEQDQNPNNENQALNELNLNLPLNQKNNMKQSLQCYYQQEVNQQKYCDFLQEMKRVKLKTQRIMHIDKENSQVNRKYLHQRRTFDVMTERPTLEKTTEGQKEKRFKRIR